MPTSRFSCSLQRAIIRISGEDSAKFLHKLTTNNVLALNTNSGQYTAMLNGQGRLLFHGWLYRLAAQSTENDLYSFSKGESYIFDFKSGLADKVQRHLNMYKLRDRVSMEDVSDQLSVSISAEDSSNHEDPLVKVKDTRANWSLFRQLNSKHSDYSYNSSSYELQRHDWGVAEDECKEGSIPFEGNIDLYGAIDYNKGCYLGQELVARTHHQGVVRKRLMPYRIYGSIDSISNLDSVREQWALRKDLYNESIIDSDLLSISIEDGSLKTGESIYGTVSKQSSQNIGWAVVRVDEFRKNSLFAIKCQEVVFLAEAFPPANFSQ